MKQIALTAIIVLLVLSSLVSASGAQSRIAATGILQSRTDVGISAEIGGRVVEIRAREGDQVEAGDLLIRLDDELLLAQIQQARAVVEAAEAQLAKVKRGARSLEIEAQEAVLDGTRAGVEAARAAVNTAEANRRGAQARYEMAQAKLARFSSGPSQRELEAAQIRLELSRVQLWAIQALRDATRAGIDIPLSIPIAFGQFELGTVIVANPVGPQTFDVSAAEAKIVEAETAIRVVEREYARLQAGPRAEDLATLEARVAEAQAGVQIAQSALERARQAVSTAAAQQQQAQAQLELLQAGPKPEQVVMAEAQVAQAQAEVAVLETQRQKLTLAAPIQGLVVERLVRRGETVIPGARLFTISNLDPVLLTIYIPESQIGRIRLGQAAQVHSEAHTGQTFAGEVVHVASQAEFTPRHMQSSEDRGTVVFGVRIAVSNPDGLLKPGTRAEAVLR